MADLVSRVRTTGVCTSVLETGSGWTASRSTGLRERGRFFRGRSSISSSRSSNHSADGMSDATHLSATGTNAVSRSWDLGKKIDPRYLIAFLITLVLVTAQLRYRMFGGYERLALSLAVCLATEAALSWFDRGKVVNLLS